MIEKLVKKYRRFITFSAVGVMNTLIDFLVFTLCSEVFALAPAPSHAIGYCCGMANSFIFNHNFTFRDTSAGGIIWSQFLRFITVNLTSLIVSTILIDYLTKAGLWLYFAKAVVIVAVMLINYFGCKLLVFNKRK